MKTTIYTETCESYELTREQFIVFLEHLWIEVLDDWREDFWNSVLKYEQMSKQSRNSQLNVNYANRRCLTHWNYESDFGGTKYYFNATEEATPSPNFSRTESFHVAIERDGEKSIWLKSIVNLALRNEQYEPPFLMPGEKPPLNIAVEAEAAKLELSDYVKKSLKSLITGENE